MDKSNDLEFMKDYLFNAMTFEKYVYTWNNALSLVNGTVAKNENQKNKEKVYLDKIESDLSNLNNKYSNGRTDINQMKKWAFISWVITILLAAILIYCYVNNPTGLGYLLLIPALIALSLLWLTQAVGQSLAKITKKRKRTGCLMKK